MSAANENFISEALIPAVAGSDTAQMAMGEPGLPREFLWRGEPLVIKAVVRTWKETGPCRNGSDERYVRKHWFEVVSDTDRSMKIYFDRQPRGGARGARWWLFSVS
jgi:phosphoribosylglycinamide formyltransferase-1